MSKLDALLAKYGGSEFVLNVCIAGFAKAGMHDRVASILEELQAKKYALHTNTAVVLSTLLLKAGKVDLAQTVLKFRRVSEAQQLRGQQQRQQQQRNINNIKSSQQQTSNDDDTPTDVASVAEEEVFATPVKV